MQLVEGDAVTIPIKIVRSEGHTNNVLLSIDGLQASDDRNISTSFDPRQISSSSSESAITVRLDIDDLPIMPQQRTFIVGATDGQDTATTTITLNIQPVPAPDVYLLIGQSNMVGFSGAGTKVANSGGPDEPNPRILQLNVTSNDLEKNFFNNATYTSVSFNVIESDKIVTAEDPLHVPREENNGDKDDGNYIGMGLSFAKAALNNTTQSIVLVPAAWSSSSFCDSAFPNGQWNADPTTNEAHLGNTLLFDRAVTRANIALSETDGILRGILWHQGESDSFDANCANSYAGNLERLAQQLRLRINQDRRGGELRSASANIPFVLGTMSRGIDERGDFSFFWEEKQKVDDAHRNLPFQIAHAEVTDTDEFTPDNGYPCGNDFCVHFGAAALREIGQRYYQSLILAATKP